MKRLNLAFITIVIVCAAIILASAICLRPPAAVFDKVRSGEGNMRLLGRTGEPLGISYTARWNTQDTISLYDAPELLVSAFVFSEDRKFYTHGGVDWHARLSALYQNMRHGKTVRGASTITEQVVRMINPRPRTLWSKWLEGIESAMLEAHTGKAQILEFYLNQVPYASGRRGIVQGARYYFNRDLSTLGVREMLALAVLARAPSAYDLYTQASRIDAPLERLSKQMLYANILDESQMEDINASVIRTEKPSLPVEARHFARAARLSGQTNRTTLRTTLDGELQKQVQDIIDQRVKRLLPKHVRNAAALVVDHTNGDILAWVVSGANDPAAQAGEIDAVLTPRQPGSTLKPFLYAAALDKGWTAATILDDAPVAEAVGAGLHRFRNYSNTYYGPITVREALGNSLNIPAVLTIRHVGVDDFLKDLRALGFDSLDRGASIYDEGLALGNGEVSLFELVRAYSALANKGQTLPLRFFADESFPSLQKQVFMKDTASLIGNILSDPRARALEFGADSVLNLPMRTAMKTGTSTAYRDSWTVGYNDRYTVGIWMGNLDRTPMADVTGSTGPALAARSIFSVLNKNRDTKPLYLSPALVQKDVCTRPSAPDGDCPKRTELFTPAAETERPSPAPVSMVPELVRPTQGLMIAKDPRIPSAHQKFKFELSFVSEGAEVEWMLDGRSLERSSKPSYLWQVEKGQHELTVLIHRANKTKPVKIGPVTFTVR